MGGEFLLKVLLIPSAILMPKEMRKSFGDLPTALFPLGDKPMLARICEQYADYVDEIYLVAHFKKEKISEYVNAKSLPVKIIELDELKDLGHTIYYGLTKIFESNSHVDYLYINFADSLLNEPLTKCIEDFAYFAESELNQQWTYFKEIGGHLTDIFDKGDFESGRYPDKTFKKFL